MRQQHSAKIIDRLKFSAIVVQNEVKKKRWKQEQNQSQFLDIRIEYETHTHSIRNLTKDRRAAKYARPSIEIIRSFTYSLGVCLSLTFFLRISFKRWTLLYTSSCVTKNCFSSFFFNCILLNNVSTSSVTHRKLMEMKKSVKNTEHVCTNDQLMLWFSDRHSRPDENSETIEAKKTQQHEIMFN